MKLAIVGSRSFNNYDLMLRAVQYLISEIPIDLIISGGARGADKLAELVANELGIPTEIYPADWDRFGKQAGFLRNETMAKEADIIMAFWDGESKGTKHMIKTTNKLGKTLILYRGWNDKDNQIGSGWF